AQIAASFRLRWNEEFLGRRCTSAVSLIVKEEKCFVLAVVEFRNGYGAAEAAAKGIELFWSLLGKVQNLGAQRVVLQVLEQAAVKLVGATLRCERDVADLRELSVVVERSDDHLPNSLRRGVSVLQGAILKHVGGRDSIHGETRLG